MSRCFQITQTNKHSNLVRKWLPYMLLTITYHFYISSCIHHRVFIWCIFLHGVLTLVDRRGPLIYTFNCPNLSNLNTFFLLSLPQNLSTCIIIHLFQINKSHVWVFFILQCGSINFGSKYMAFMVNLPRHKTKLNIYDAGSSSKSLSLWSITLSLSFNTWFTS